VGHKRKAHERETFADILEGAQAENPHPWTRVSRRYYSPTDEGEYTDKRGVHWRLRGGELRWPRIQQLILDHQVPIVHVYLREVREVPDDERADLAARVRPYLKGMHIPPDDYTHFTAAEFKDDHRRSLLAGHGASSVECMCTDVVRQPSGRHDNAAEACRVRQCVGFRRGA